MEDGKLQQQPPRKRRRLTGEKKYQILQEVRLNPGKKAEILRREGLYQNDLKRFEDVAREAGVKALGQMHPGKKRVREVPSEQHEALKKEHDAQEKALAALTVEFMALKKKVNGE
jgi:transposase-like protein